MMYIFLLLILYTNKMKNFLLLITTLFLFSLQGNAQTKVWNNDPDHSRLGFTIKHLTISEVEGTFDHFKVMVVTSKSDYSDAQVELTAQIASINTNSKKRDEHLLGEEFFEESKYTTLTFKSTSAKHLNTKHGVLLGNLTMHGITKPIKLKVEYFGSVINPMSKKETAGFKVTGTVKRADYAIGDKYPGAVLGKSVKIEANLEFSPDK